MVIFAITLGLLPSFIWLIFFLKEDIHPEPKKAVVKVFLAGALMTIPTVALQMVLQKYAGYYGIGQYSISLFLIFAAIEESLKFFAAYYLINKSKLFDEPVDAMIYMITAALGFAAMENILALLDGIIWQEMAVDTALTLMVLRFVGATLLHALSSATIGYYWAKDLKGSGIIAGIIFASLLHGFFNYLILEFNTVLVYPTIFLIIFAFVIFWDFEKIKIRN